MRTEQTRPFHVEYPHDGARWAATIHAVSHEDAERRLKALGAWGQVRGETVEVIHVPRSMGLLGRAWADLRVWWLSRRRA